MPRRLGGVPLGARSHSKMIWGCFLEDFRLHFGTLEGHFDELGAHRHIWEDSLGFRVRFYGFSDDFGVLLGPSLGSFW